VEIPQPGEPVRGIVERSAAAPEEGDEREPARSRSVQVRAQLRQLVLEPVALALPRVSCDEVCCLHGQQTTDLTGQTPPPASGDYVIGT
jgi:hypothetical protein